MRTLNLKFLLCLLGGVVVLTTTLFVAHHLQYKRIAPALLRQAQKAEDECNLERTDQFLSRYLEFNPDDIEQRARLAKLLADPKYMRTPAARRRAYEQLEYVLARDPARHDLRRLVIPLALGLDRLKEAGQHLEALQQAAPNDGAVANMWGQFHEARKQPDQAIVAYRDAVKYAPQDIDAYKNLARLLRTQRFEGVTGEQLVSRRKTAIREADDVMASVVKQNPDSWQAYVARWSYLRDHYVIQLKQKDTPLVIEAQANLARALELAEGQPDVRLAAAEFAQLQDKIDAAREHLEKALQLHRDDPRIYRGFAQIELSQNKWEELTPAKKDEARQKAYTHLRRGVKDLKGYNQFDVMWSFAKLLLDRSSPEDLAEAQQLIDAIKATNQWNAYAEFLQARLAFGRQQWADSAKQFERVRTKLEDIPELQGAIDLHLARCYGQLEESHQQYNAYRRLANREPDNVVAHMGMAQAAQALGQQAEAMNHFRKAAQLENAPGSASVEMVRLMIRQARVQKSGAKWQEIENVLDQMDQTNKDKEKIAAVVLRAEYLLARDKPQEAADLLEKSQITYPNSAQLWIARAMLAQQQRDPDKALQILDDGDKALKNQPGSKALSGDRIDLRLERARYWELRANEQSKAELVKLGEDVDTFDPAERERLLNGLATCHYRAGHLDEASKLWTKLASSDTYRADLRLWLVLFDLAVQQGQQERMDEVIKDIRTIENGDGTYGRHAQALRLIWLYKQGKLDEKERAAALEQARDLLTKVASSRPGWSAIPLARAEIEELKGNPDKAIDHYREAVKLGERNPLVLRQLITALRKQGHDKQADDELRKLTQNELLAGDLQKLAADLSVRTGDPSRGVKLALEAVKSDSRDYRDHLWLGQILYATGQRHQEAEQKFQRALELGGNELDPWLAMTEFLIVQKREKEAEALVAQIPTRVSAERRALTTACCYRLFGKAKAKETLEQFQAALKAQPTNPRTLQEFAAYHMQGGNMTAAEPLLRKMLEEAKDPTDNDREWAATRLAVLLSAQGDWEKFKEALTFVGLKIDAACKVSDDRTRCNLDTLEIQRTRARVLATQPMNKVRDEAIKRFEDLERRHTLSVDDRFILARLYESKTAWVKGREQFSLLSREPQVRLSHVIYYIQGLLRQGELVEAERQLTKLKQAEKTRPTPAGTLALIELQARWLEANNQAEKAITLLKDRLRQKESDPQEILLLVSALGRQKKFTEALALIDDVWKNCPVETAGGTSVALLRSTRDSDADRKNVQTRLRAALEKSPKNAVLWVQLGDLEDLRNEFEEAEKCYRKALEFNEREQMALNNLAWLLATRQRKTDEALALINKAIGASGPRSELLDTRAIIYLTMNRTADALADLNEAIAETATATRYFHLARVHHQANNRDLAAKAMRQARDMKLTPAQLHPVEQVAYNKLSTEFKAE